MTLTTDFAHLAMTDCERGMLGGEHGPATALAMRILARMAPLYGSDRFLPVTRAHIDGIVYEGSRVAERLADLGGQVQVPTSLNVMSMDRSNWRELGKGETFRDECASPGLCLMSHGRGANIYLCSVSNRSGARIR